MPTLELTVDRLREYLDYDPLTGRFSRRLPQGKSRRFAAGTEPGTLTDKGYRRITIDGRQYMAHQLAWLHYYGVWSPTRLDHKNEVKSDNWIGNLRCASRRTNAENKGRANSNNRSGWLGVHYRPRARKYHAQICVDKRVQGLGHYVDPEEAHLIYLVAKAFFHPGALCVR